MTKLKYLAITPACNQEEFLPRLIASMTGQTLKPERWIIIDQGSSDATAEIVERAAMRHRWIEPHHLPAPPPRVPGGESVIMRFLPREEWSCYDAILRLEADLSFRADFVELLATEFIRNPRLGIAGATLYEPKDNAWREIRNPVFHTRGAVKLYSRECFAAIGGLEAGLGWDTVDEARAMMEGFESRSFRHIRAYHHRAQGAADGYLRANLGAGRAAYNAGYHPLFLLARALRRGFAWPPLLGGAFMLAGYLQGYLDRGDLLASPDLVKFIRKQQLRRLLLMESVWR